MSFDTVLSSSPSGNNVDVYGSAINGTLCSATSTVMQTSDVEHPFAENASLKSGDSFPLFSGEQGLSSAPSGCGSTRYAQEESDDVVMCTVRERHGRAMAQPHYGVGQRRRLLTGDVNSVDVRIRTHCQKWTLSSLAARTSAASNEKQSEFSTTGKCEAVVFAYVHHSLFNSLCVSVYMIELIMLVVMDVDMADYIVLGCISRSQFIISVVWPFCADIVSSDISVCADGMLIIFQLNLHSSIYCWWCFFLSSRCQWKTSLLPNNYI